MASCARRTVQLEEDELPYRKGSNATIRSEGTGTQYYTKHGIVPMYDSNETLRQSRPVSTASTASMRVRRISSLIDGNTRFPKLEDCAHFHYDFVELTEIQACLLDDENELYHHNGEDVGDHIFFVQVTSGDRTWTVRRTIQNFRMLDQKLHRCIYDRKFSHLPEIGALELDDISPQELRGILRDYLLRFSSLAGSMLNCGSVLNWLEIDNRGNHLVAVDDSGINTPAIAAAHAVKRYTAQAADEISLEVGDIVSVIDMPPADDTIWWRGKRGFEVGFFPFECVEVIGEKLPSFVSSIPETPRNKQLLKTHGKFLNFLRTFFTTRPERNQLKQSGIVKERVFGCDLGEHLLNSGHDVPLVLKSCTDVIETHGLVDGIYRLSGITSNIQKLRLAFDEDRVPDLTSEIYLQDVHSISSLLKMYFRELPNPLLTYQLYDKFAEAVRDEDNKLLKIHDVVQQLPPPHYRTTEYLMRHLARVAAHGQETGMHSKNLAIVWAPNLLRSKELESGGGAAALRGVGIQAVVTEFLILYAELIFSDKMPSYSSPELKKTQRKPRPKSLAISTPTRLLTLEEARERALNTNMMNPVQKYIDVGGGPQNLPAKYHTVIDLPGYRKKGSKDSGGGKMKKSPGGFRSLFARTRSGSIRQKGHKPSIHESLNFEAGERKAITEEDVQHWKRRRIRSAKSAESLLSLPVTSRLGSPLTESLDPNKLMNLLSGSDNSSPTKYPRSLSIDSPGTFNSPEESSLYPSFFLDESGGREMPIDVNPDDIELDFNDDSPGKENVEGSDNRARRKQSFIRNEQKRRVICHRRTPSAPTTPKRDYRDPGSSCHDTDEILKQQLNETDKSVSQPVLQGALSAKPPRIDRAKTSQKKLFESDSFVADSAKDRYGSADEIVSEKRKGSKTPPKDRKKLKDEKHSIDHENESEFHSTREDSDKENFDGVHKDPLIKKLNESPGSKRKVWTRSASTPDEHHTDKGIHHFYSRFHDYAEIDDNDLDPSITESHNARVASGSDCTVEHEKHKTSPKQDTQTRRYHIESIENLKDLGNVESQIPIGKTEVDSTSDTSSEPRLLETNFFMDNKQPVVVHSVPADHSSRTSSNSDNSSVNSSQRYLPHEDLLSEISNFEKGLESIQQYPYKKPISKCMSIPSDIQKSLENISNGSDIMSSVTISELSQSQDNVFVSETDTLTRRRRSTSLDGLQDESPMSRTLREINAQIDRAFKQEKHKAQSLHNLQGSSGVLPKGGGSDIASQLISYDIELEETVPKKRSFGSVRESDLKSPVERTFSEPVRHNIDKNQSKQVSKNVEFDSSVNENKFIDRPGAEIHIIETPQVVRAPLKSSEQNSSTSTTPTRPVPPGSLDIVSPTCKQNFVPQSKLPASQSDTHISQNNFQGQSNITSPSLPPRSSNINKITLESKTGFRLSEEDFQKALLSEDPDSLRHFQKSMMYSPVRSHRRGILDGERSNRSSLASPDAGGQKGISGRSSFASPEGSPGSYSRQSHPKVSQSPDASPGSYARHQHSKSSSSPQAESRHQHSKVPQSPKSENRSYRSQQTEKGSYHPSPPVDKRTKDSPVIEKKGPSPKIEKKYQDRSVVQSPLSPEHKQPRWEDLAGLNDSFSDIDLAVFNDDWKNQLAPTGDSIRQSNNASQLTDKWSSQNEVFPEAEVSTDTDTVTVERPSIKRKTFPDGVTQLSDSKSTLGEIEYYDNVPEHESLRPDTQSGLIKSENRTETPVARSERPLMQRSNTVPQSALAQSPSSQAGFTVRSVLERSNTVPGPSAVPLSPTMSPPNRRGLGSVVEQSGSFESISGLPRQVSFDTGLDLNSSFNNVEKSALKKSSVSPSLTRQTSFDTSSYSSVRVTSLGSSFEELDCSSQNQQAIQTGQSGHISVRQEKSSVTSHSVIQGNETRNISNQSAGTFISFSADDRNKNAVATCGAIEPSGFALSSRQSSQSSVLIRSDSSQSADISFPEHSQTGGRFRNYGMVSNISDNLPRMLEEIDPNESCLGLASHQNMSNEMKEMMQEQMKEHAGIMSPLDEIINPLSTVTSPFALQSRTFYDTSHPLEGHDMESSIEVPSDVQSVDLPVEERQVLSEGPVVIASPNVLTQLNTNSLPRHQHIPIDNTEEEYQNAINADLERNLANLTQHLPQHVSVCEPQGQLGESGETTQTRMVSGENTDTGGTISSIGFHAPGLEHLTLISPSSYTIKETPEPVTRDSNSSSSSSSMVSSTSSITQTPTPTDWTFRQSVFKPAYPENLNIQGDLAAPPLEMIEICKSVITKPKTRHVNTVSSQPENKIKSPVGKSITLTFDFPSSKSDRNATSRSSEGPSKRMSAERGETKLIIDRRPSLKKKADHSKNETVLKPKRQEVVELIESDHGDQSGSEDDVFIDPSEITPETNFYGAKSKYFQRRDFLSQGSFPPNQVGAQNVQKPEIQAQKTKTDPLARCSLDESLMQMASSRHEDPFSKNMLDSDYSTELVGMDIGHESSEDIRFSKAHRSSKLMSLCEMFEKGSTTSLNSDGEDNVKEKTITPPEKDIVSSIKHMHESFEVEKEDNDIFNKPRRIKKVSLNESGSSNDSFNVSKDDSFESKTERKDVFTDKPKQCLSPTYTSAKEGSFLFEAPGSVEGYRVGRPPNRSSDTVKESAGHGKPPKYRSNSKTRTPSESSLSENEGIKSSQKVAQTDTSPKSHRHSGSPKGSRYSQISSEENGSPRVGRPSGSPNVLDRKTDGSPKQGRPKEGPPVAPRQSPKMSKSLDSSSRTSGSPKSSRFGDTSDQQSPRYSNSPKSQHNGRGSAKADASPKVRQRQDSTERGEKEVQKRSITKRGESIEERYHLNFEHESQAKENERVSSPGEEKRQQKGEEKKRRGSIKELLNLFEEKTGGRKSEGEKTESPEQSPPQLKLRTRVRSVSPTSAATRSPPTMPTNVRHSVELPVRGTLSHSEGVFRIPEGIYRPQQVRLGPKPFYGAK